MFRAKFSAAEGPKYFKQHEIDPRNLLLLRGLLEPKYDAQNLSELIFYPYKGQ